MPRLFIPLHIRFELSECMEYDPMALRRRTMSLLPSHVITTRDGDTVHAFVGDNGGIYRTCSGSRCAYCTDIETARAYLSYWRRKPTLDFV